MNADLGRFYRISLDDLHSGRVSASTVADYAAHMPRGGALGQAMGGVMAVTAEVEALWGVEHVLIMTAWNAGGRKGSQPKHREYPEGTAVEKAKRERVIAQAKAHQAKRRQSKN